MFPNFPGDDHGNEGLFDSESLSDLLLKNTSLAQRFDDRNVSLDQFSTRMRAASYHRSVFVLVVNIVLAGIPAKVLDAIVSSIAIVVARLHSIRARTDKRFQNKPMDKFWRPDVMVVEVDLRIAMGMFRRSEFSPEKHSVLPFLPAIP